MAVHEADVRMAHTSALGGAPKLERFVKTQFRTQNRFPLLLKLL